MLNKILDNRKDFEKRKTIAKQYFDTNELTQMTGKIEGNPKENPITRLLPVLVRNHIFNNRIKSEDEKLRVKKVYFEKYKDFTESEKQFRLAKTCDIVLFMIADDMFRKNFVVDKSILKNKNKVSVQDAVEIGKGYKLSEIKPNSDEGFLSLQTRVELQIQDKTIIKEQIKIKNYGDFRGLLKDRKIGSLLPFIADKEIQFEALQKELEFYDKARIDVFAKIFEFEKSIIAKMNLQKNPEGFINHKDILKSLISENDERFILVMQLRNAFSHSNYPDYSLFKDKVADYGFNDLKNHTSNDDTILVKSFAVQFKNLILSYYDELSRI